MVWDFRKNMILVYGLISHGCGINPWSGIWSKDKPTFSNVANSHCSSLGKYQVGERAASAWGIHTKYYLKGLENTNSNAFIRDVILHSGNGFLTMRFTLAEHPKTGAARPFQIIPSKKWIL
jgi:hypothetical protein